MLPQKFFRFISSEIASGVILNMFALFVTLLFWYSRSRRGASARSYGAPYVRFIVVYICQAVETRAAHVYNRVWCNFFLMLTRLVRDYIQSCEEGRCCIRGRRGGGGGGNGPCVPPPPPPPPPGTAPAEVHGTNQCLVYFIYIPILTTLP